MLFEMKEVFFYEMKFDKCKNFKNAEKVTQIILLSLVLQMKVFINIKIIK